MITMEKYFKEAERLSLTSRMIVCLINFENFCVNEEIGCKSISEFTDYMWKWPLINGPDEFDPWVSSLPRLVDFALGNELPEDVLENISSKGIEEIRFRNIVEGLVEIVWSSFWGAAENQLSMECFVKSIRSSKVAKLPPLTPFKISKFSEGGGWGEKITVEDYEFWRGCRPNA